MLANLTCLTIGPVCLVLIASVPVIWQALADLKGKTEEIPCVVGDEHVWTKDIRYQLSVSRPAQQLPVEGD